MADAHSTATRTCKKCGIEKCIQEFPVRSCGERRYRQHSCRDCINKDQNRRHAKTEGQRRRQELVRRNAELLASGIRTCRSCDRTLDLSRFRKKGAAHAHQCLDCSNAAQRERYAKNEGGIRDRLVAHGKKYREKHGQAANERKREYVSKNRQKVTDRQNAWAKAKLKSDKLFAIKKRIRSMMSNAFRSIASQKSAETEALLGCTFQEFMVHIEKQFHDGMSWGRKSEIHLDHIVPLATAKTEEDVVRLSHFTNLRPMWARDNIAKADKQVYLI